LTNLFKEQLQSISQLIGTKKIESINVVHENNEEGYAVSSVNSEVNVLLLVKVVSYSLPLIPGTRGSRFTSHKDRR
jgi:hypothetical protein